MPPGDTWEEGDQEIVGFETFDEDLFEKAAESGIFDSTVASTEASTEVSTEHEIIAPESAHQAHSGGFSEAVVEEYEYYGSAETPGENLEFESFDPLLFANAAHENAEVEKAEAVHEEVEEQKTVTHFVGKDSKEPSSAFTEWLEN
jgi:hypothetical protein